MQALNDGDVTPAVLEQSFFLSPEHINEYNDISDFYWNVCSALLGTNVSYGNEDAFYPYFEQGGPVLAYKQLLGLDFNPYALDVLLVYPYDAQAACGLYAEICDLMKEE